MVQGYYTLEEAAQILQMPADELNQMRERKEIRAFADRGTWRFRTQDIEELARRRGAASDVELPIRPPSKSRTPGDAGEVFQFPLVGPSGELPLPPLPGDSTEDVPIGRDRPGDSSRVRRPDSKRPDSSKRTDSKRTPKGPPSPYPSPAGDSDVRLVAEGSDVGFQIASDSDVKLEDQGAAGRAAPPSSARRKPPSTARTDSGVRLVDDKASDSDVKIIPDSDNEIPLGDTPAIDSGTESDVRLDMAGATGSKRRLDSDSFLTEEIDLDAELRKAEEAARAQRDEGKPPKVKGKTPPPSSPFELSEIDLHLPTSSSSTEGLARRIAEDSSDFDLTIDPSDSLSPLEPSSGETAALKDEDAIGQASARRVTGTEDSGINLEEPSDAGISLEDDSTSSGDVDFELSVEEPQARKSSRRKKPGQERQPDSSSEFELTLDDSVRLAQEDNIPTDSIRVESARLAPGDSGVKKGRPLDSAPLAKDDSSRRGDSGPSAKGDRTRPGSAPPAKGRKKPISQQDSVRVSPKALDSMRVRDDSAKIAGSERLVPVDDDGTALKPDESGEDIFETDFEVPALEAESGSEVVPLDESDTDLESSDFDLALSDDDIATDSSKRRPQVVPVDEEDVDEGAATISKKRSIQEYVDDESGETVSAEGEMAEEEVAPSRRRVVVPAAPADWGVFAPVTLMVSTLFMFFVALMSIELMNGMWGFHQPNKASSLMIRAIGGMIPGVDSKDLERD